MANYAVTDTQLTAIADAIRLKRGTAEPMGVDDMPMQIGLIDGTGDGGGTGAEVLWARDAYRHDVINNWKTMISNANVNFDSGRVITTAGKKAYAWFCVPNVDVSRYRQIVALFTKTSSYNIYTVVATSDPLIPPSNLYGGGWAETLARDSFADTNRVHNVALSSLGTGIRDVWFGFDTNDASWSNARDALYLMSLIGILK